MTYPGEFDVYDIAYASTSGGGMNVLPQGVTALSSVGVGTGSGGTAGTYRGGVAGGPAGFAWEYSIGTTGKIASYQILNPGRSTAGSVPTLSYPAGGLTGATPPVATVGSTITANDVYLTPSVDGSSNLAWKNAGSGVPVAVTTAGGQQLSLPTWLDFVPNEDWGIRAPLIPTFNASDRTYAAFNSLAMSATIAKLKAISGVSNVAPNRAVNRPFIQVPAGTYVLDPAVTHLIDFVGFDMRGEGKNSTTLVWEGTAGALFDMGAFSATPADIFAGTAQGYGFRDLSILKPTGFSNTNYGSRTGIGIRDNGSGGATLDQVRFGGLAYGFDGAYGSDFDKLTGCEAQFCDVAFYFGPGTNQLTTVNLYAYQCREGLVHDRVSQATHIQPWFVGCGESALTIESMLDQSATRQLTSFPRSGTSYDGQTILDSPWLEANPGNAGNLTIPNQFIKVSNPSMTAYSRLTVKEAWIGAGESAAEGANPAKSVSAFIKNTEPTGAGLQRIEVERPSFQGKMGFWLAGLGISRAQFRNIRIVDGYDLNPPALTDGASAATNIRFEDEENNTTYWGSLVFPEIRKSINDTDGWRTYWKYDATGNKVLHLGHYIGGMWYDRLGFDIGNRRIFLGEPDSAPALSRSAAMPTAGHWNIGSFVYNIAPAVVSGRTLLGWQRLTTGTNHVAGTDWVPTWAATS